jgi:hypothetical protein
MLKEIIIPFCVQLERTISTRSVNAPEGAKTSNFEIFHEQLPLPVPCYDLLPVIELTVDHYMNELRVFPTPLS